MTTRRTFERTVLAGFGILAVLLALGMAFSIRRLAAEANDQVAAFRAEELKTPYFLGKPFRYEQVIALVNRALVERVPPHHQPRASGA